MNLSFYGLILGLIGCTYEIQEDEMPKGLFGWSQSGTLLVGDPNRSVSLQADFTQGAFGQSYTAQFGLSKPTQQTYIRPWADITWKVAGNEVRRRVSVTDGLSVSGVAEAVSIRMYDTLRASGDGNVTMGTAYVASINLAPGNRPAQNQPPQWIPIDYTTGAGTLPSPGRIVVAGGESFSIIIPENIGAISVMATASVSSHSIVPADNVRMEQIGPASLVLRRTSVNEFATFTPLAPGAIALLLSNSIDPASDVGWSVAFGIDG